MHLIASISCLFSVNMGGLVVWPVFVNRKQEAITIQIKTKLKPKPGGGTGATYKWGLDDPQDIKQLEPKLELIKELRPSEQVAFSRFPLWWRAIMRVQEVNSTLRRMNRTVVYRF